MKYTNSQRFIDSLHEQHTLFWHNSPSEEERDYRVAKFGFYLSIVLVGLLGFAELAFLLVLLWDFVK